MMEVIRLIYEESIKLLKRQGVEFETGLTVEEIAKIEDIYKIKGQILEITRKPRTGKAFQNFTGYQICHRKVSFQCFKISNSIHAISAANPTQKIF